VVLPERKAVVVPRGEVAVVQADPGESGNLRDLSLRKKAIGDSALIEDLDGARVQTACTRAHEFVTGTPLDDRHVHARQCQLARQHQSGRTSSDDHHRVLGHRQTPMPP
jgi:hypothetical protein